MELALHHIAVPAQPRSKSKQFAFACYWEPEFLSAKNTVVQNFVAPNSVVRCIEGRRIEECCTARRHIVGRYIAELTTVGLYRERSRAVDLGLQSWIEGSDTFGWDIAEFGLAAKNCSSSKLVVAQRSLLRTASVAACSYCCRWHFVSWAESLIFGCNLRPRLEFPLHQLHQRVEIASLRWQLRTGCRLLLALQELSVRGKLQKVRLDSSRV